VGGDDAVAKVGRHRAVECCDAFEANLRAAEIVDETGTRTQQDGDEVDPYLIDEPGA
jgi:hypothetical protein